MYPAHWSPELCAAHFGLVAAMCAAQKVAIDSCSSPLHQLADESHARHFKLWERFKAGMVAEAEIIVSMRATEVCFRQAANDKTSLHAVARDAVLAALRDLVCVVNVEPVGPYSLQLSAGVEAFIEPTIKKEVVAEGHRATIVAFDALAYHDLVGERAGLPPFKRGRSHIIVLEGESATAWPLKTGTMLSVIEGARA